MYKQNSRSQYQPRRRGFDDDNQGFGFGGPRPAPRRSSPPSIQASGPERDATVKWFNSEKGFGFVELGDGTGDAFLHANALSSVGYDSVSPGATLRVRVGQGQKGPQVAEVLSVDESTATPNAGRSGSPRGAGAGGGFRPRPQGGMGRREHDLSSAVEMTGTVKWYNPEKGFGFVVPNGGGKDVFVHASVLERAGLRQVNEGQAVQMQVVQGAKGPEAATISVA
jgi:cold shock protein